MMFFNPLMVFFVTACIGGATTFFYGIHQYAEGQRVDKLRSDAVIAKMVGNHQREVNEANARADALSESWRLAQQGAAREQERERAASRAQLAAVNADRQRMREQLDTVASGGVEAGADSIAACRDRAGRLGRVLDEALQASAVCAGDAEDLACRGPNAAEILPSGGTVTRTMMVGVGGI